MSNAAPFNFTAARAALVGKLVEEGPQPLSALGVTQNTVNALIGAGVIEKGAAVLKTGQRGRPSHTYKVTVGGRSRYSTFLRAEAAAAAAAEVETVEAPVEA